jgi:outer membrane protein W
MKRLVFILLFACRTFAADFEAGVRHVVVFQTGQASDLDLPLSRGFAATADVFWTERISTQFAATFINPEAILFPPNAEPVDLGTLGLDTYSASVRWHFAPQSRFGAYAGGGAALVQIGNLDDQFGEDVEAKFDSETAFLVEGGLRYRLLPRLFVELGVTYMPLSAETNVIKTNVNLPAEVGLDPVTVSGGVAWRF